MTGTDQPSYQTRSARAAAPAPTGWTGWVGFFQAIQGLVAIFKDSYYLVRPSGLVVNVDYTVWGWVHLVIGLLAFFAGYGVFSAKTWARAVGIVLAGLSAVANFAFLASFPIWSTIVIVVDIVIIYALAAHGREMKPL
jgi:hypothetical protein